MLSIDEAIAHAREVAKEKRKEMQCKTCKLFARSDLHPLQGYCRKNEFRSIEIDSWRKVCSEYVPKEMCKCAEEHNNGWIPCSERYPDNDNYVLLSFENFSIPCVGRYEEDENGGAFYIGDEDESCVSQDVFVNAWQPLPEPYRESEQNDGNV